MGKRLLGSFLIFVILVVVVVGGAIWYVRPSSALSLQYEEVDLRSKILQMVGQMSTQFVLSEEEMNQLLLKALSQKPNVAPDVVVQGAKFQIENGQLVADLNLLYRDLIPVGARLYFDLSWKDPTIEAVHSRTEIKSFQVPQNWVKVPTLRVSVADKLPTFAKFSRVDFKGEGIIFEIKINLRELIK